MNTIEVRGVELGFPRARMRPRGLKDAALSLVRPPPPGSRDPFMALRGVDLTVRKGEVLGLVGHNGSGKSTLLRVVCGIYAPDKGTVKVEGRISALLELGAGFREELDGLENIRLSGAIMGLSPSEVEQLVAPIVAFADLGEFIEQPLRTYSSGMKARLGFSVAAALDPDVLLIDEALAVGDARFKEKSMARIQEMVAGDTTVVIVSHNQRELRRLCDRLVLLRRGKVVADGTPEAILEMYENE